MRLMASRIRLIGITSTIFLSMQIHASGYHFGVQSVSAQGVANAAGAAAQDATTIFYNPAGLVYLPGRHVSGVMIVVAPHTKVSNVSAKTALGTAVTGTPFKDSATSTVFVPQFYYTQQINEQLFAGVGVFVPFGDKINYSDTWVGRYNGVKLDMKTFALNPQVAYKVNDQFSFGLGLTAQYVRAEFRKKADFGTATQLDLTGAGALDGELSYQGHDVGLGWNIGAMWQVDPTLRLGAAYRASISQTLSGDVDWSYGNLPAPAVTNLKATGYISSPDGQVKLETPDSFSLNFYKTVNLEWTLMGDWTYTRHSKFQALGLKFSNSVKQAVIEQNWKNTHRYALGATYRASDKWLVRAGVAYDQTPIPGKEFRIATLPDSDRTWYSIGANYALSKDTSLDLAYTYVHIRNASMHNKECSPVSCTSSGTTTRADFKSRANLFGLQLNHRF